MSFTLLYFNSSVVEKALLVMENLFYECDIKNKFDLKGSERNRLVDPNNQQQGDTVLLDENFVQSMNLKTYLQQLFKTMFLQLQCPGSNRCTF